MPAPARDAAEPAPDRSPVPYTLRSGLAPYLAAAALGTVGCLTLVAMRTEPYEPGVRIARFVLPWVVGSLLVSRVRSVGRATFASTALACLVLLANVLPRAWAAADERWVPVAMASVMAGAVLGLIAAPPVAAAAQARASGALDETDFVMGVSALWAALITGLMVAVGWMTEDPGAWAAAVARGQVQFALPVAGLAVSLLALGVASARHGRRLAWLRRVYAGREAGWRVELAPEAAGRAELPPLSTVQAPLDAVLVRLDAGRDGPFRAAHTALPVARVTSSAERMVSPRSQQLYVLMMVVGGLFALLGGLLVAAALGARHGA